jgi:hypothetical protein
VKLFFFAVVTSFIGTVLYTAAVAACTMLKAQTPRVAELVARLATLPLPARHRARYLEEWSAEIRDVPHLRRLRYALGLLTLAPRIAWQLWQRPAPRRGRLQFVVAIDEIAEINGWVAGAFPMEQANDGVRYRLEYARRQDDGLRVVVLTRFIQGQRHVASEEIGALLREGIALGQVKRTGVHRKARQGRKNIW